MTSKKKALKSNLGIDFGFPKPPKLFQKAMLNEACFAAMEITPGSSKINGAHSFWTTNMATHMIRSSWSASRRPNHQSKVCNLTCSTHISAQWTKESKNIVQRHSNPWKSSSEGLKIHSKSSFKAILLQRKPSNLNFFEKLWFFNDTATTEIYTILFVGSVRCV